MARTEYQNKWRKENPAKVVEYRRRYYEKNRKKGRDFSREYYKKNKEAILDRIRKKKYGIEGEKYREMVEAQGGLCIVCQDKMGKNLSVDHCHKNNNIRGIICNNCNLSIGNAKDSPEILRRLANYLENVS